MVKTDDRLGEIFGTRQADFRRRLYRYGRVGGTGLVRYDAVLRGEDVAGAAGRAPTKVTKKVQARVRQQLSKAYQATKAGPARPPEVPTTSTHVVTRVLNDEG